MSTQEILSIFEQGIKTDTITEEELAEYIDILVESDGNWYERGGIND